MGSAYPPPPDDGPSTVSIHRQDFIDKDRLDTNGNARLVPVKFTFPLKPDRKLPIIVWSHGLGGSREGAGFLNRYLASHGYIVITVTHIGTDTSLWEGKPGHPWDNIRQAKISRKDTLQRFKDIPFVLDSLEGWAAEYPETGKYMDLASIGMSGHSFGAATTQVMAGQLLGRKGRHYSLKEERFKAAIAYSPSVTYNHSEDSDVIYKPISVPMLYMTGTNDDSPVSGKGYDYRIDIFENAGGPDQYLMILEEGDHMVFAGSRGRLGVNPHREKHEALIKHMALTFWNAYLKDDNEAKSWLQEKAKDFLTDEGSFKTRQLLK